MKLCNYERGLRGQNASTCVAEMKVSVCKASIDSRDERQRTINVQELLD